MFKKVNRIDKEGLMKKDEWIQKYKQGKLTNAEKLEFQALVQNDAEFSKDLAEYEKMQRAISAHEKDVLKARLQQLETTQETTLPKSTKNYKRLAIAIVLILCVGLIGNYFLQQANRSENLYATYFEPYPNALVPVTRTDGEISQKSAAMYAYETKNYEKAIEILDTLLQHTNDQRNAIVFYKAMSLQNLNRVEEAVVILEELKTTETQFLPQVYWYSALISIKQKQYEKALENLKFLDELATAYKEKERKFLKMKLQQ